MKYPLLIVLVIFLSCFSQAQENISRAFNGSFNVYPVDTVGVVLLNRNLRRLSTGDLALEFRGLDKELKNKWKNLYPFSKGLSPVFQQISSQGIAILFADESKKEYELIKASADFGEYEQFKYSFSEALEVNELAYFYDHVWVSGTLNSHPVVIKLEADNTFSVVPTALPGLVKYAGQLKFDRNTRSINFALVAEIDSEDILVWRSMSTSGQMLKNQKSSGFEKNMIRGIEATYSNGTALFAGTYSVGTKERIEGIFLTDMNEDKAAVKYHPFKPIIAMSRFRKIDAAKFKGLGNAREGKLRMADKSVFIDDLSISSDGQTRLTLEVFKPEYRSRGALERQVIERDQLAQIDRSNGRSTAFFGDPSRQELDGRIGKYSATDQLQYRFIGQNLGKAVNQGRSYSHTAVLEFDNDLKMVDDYGLSFDLTDFGRLAQKKHLVANKLTYFWDGFLMQLDVTDKKLKIIEAHENTGLIYWKLDRVLQIEVDQKTNKMTLTSREVK